ncbi:hypothetical protein [Streptomyces sp. YIM 98790]|uniref:hypothetical protein n=1 Tax=Streptomyces sp. YIM 98790 TaxID=2689077 RepID=UPI00140DB965|nr:hypothetical protein [Streptomyces sp. YIM 98790]
MHEPTPRASRLRTTAFASAVALVLGLPLAFVTVGPSPSAGTPPDAGAAGAPHTGVAAPAPGPHHPGSGPGTMAGAGAFCGTEVSSPEGVRAQACVLTQGPETWGRLYWSNDSSRTLTGRLTVHRPDGGRVQVQCTLPPGDEPGTCETPPEPTAAERPGRQPYLAVAEVSPVGEDGEDGTELRAESEPAAENPVAGDGGYTNDRAQLRR